MERKYYVIYDFANQPVYRPYYDCDEVDRCLADRDAEIERLRAELALRKDYADQCRAQDATIHRLKLELDAYERAVREARDGVS